MSLLIPTSPSVLYRTWKAKDKIRSIKDSKDDPCCGVCQVSRKANLLQDQHPRKSNSLGTEIRTTLSDPNLKEGDKIPSPTNSHWPPSFVNFKDCLNDPKLLVVNRHLR